jgi:hypothetical protein
MNLTVPGQLQHWVFSEDKKGDATAACGCTKRDGGQRASAARVRGEAGSGRLRGQGRCQARARGDIIGSSSYERRACSTGHGEVASEEGRGTAAERGDKQG